jgi:hypothetical protein
MLGQCAVPLIWINGPSPVRNERRAMTPSDEKPPANEELTSIVIEGEDDMKPIARVLPALILTTLLLEPSIANSLEAEIRLRTDGSQTPSVIGVTNLPDETKLLVSLRRKAANYNAQLNVTVQAGQFITERFSDDGKALPPGDYALEVSMASADFQPGKVQMLIGVNGERLSGPLVENTKFGNIVISRSTIELGGTSSDAAARRENDLAMDKWRRESCEWVSSVGNSSRSVAECVAELSKN